MPINTLIKLRAAQSHLLTEYPQTESERALQVVKSDVLRQRLRQRLAVILRLFRRRASTIHVLGRPPQWH